MVITTGEEKERITLTMPRAGGVASCDC